jgi:hypothetical protein
MRGARVGGMPPPGAAIAASISRFEFIDRSSHALPCR